MQGECPAGSTAMSVPKKQCRTLDHLQCDEDVVELLKGRILPSPLAPVSFPFPISRLLHLFVTTKTVGASCSVMARCCRLSSRSRHLQRGFLRHRPRHSARFSTATAPILLNVGISLLAWIPRVSPITQRVAISTTVAQLTWREAATLSALTMPSGEASRRQSELVYRVSRWLLTGLPFTLGRGLASVL